MMKKLLPLALVLALLISLAACAGKDGRQTTAQPASTTAARITIPSTQTHNPDVNAQTYAPAALQKFGVDLAELSLPEGCTFRDVVRNGNEKEYSLLIITYHCPKDKAEESAENVAGQLFEQTAASHGGNFAVITDPATNTQSKGGAYSAAADCSQSGITGFENASWGYTFNGGLYSVYVKSSGYYNTFEVQLNALDN